MADLTDRDAGFRGLKIVREGATANVLAEAQIFEVLRKLEQHEPGRWGELREHMDRYCAGIPTTKKQFNFEGRHPCGTHHKEIGVYALKAWQFCLYGFERSINGKQCFVATCVDPSKKNDRADQKKLRKAAKLAGIFLD